MQQATLVVDFYYTQKTIVQMNHKKIGSSLTENELQVLGTVLRGLYLCRWSPYRIADVMTTYTGLILSKLRRQGFDGNTKTATWDSGK